MEKEIGQFRIKFLGDFTEENGKLNLTIIIDSNLSNFLKKCIVPTVVFKDYKIYIGNDENGDNVFITPKRFLIKAPISNIIGTSYEFLFDKELIETGKLTLNFNSFENRKNLKDNFRNGIKTLLKYIEGERINETVDYTIKKEE